MLTGSFFSSNFETVHAPLVKTIFNYATVKFPVYFYLHSLLTFHYIMSRLTQKSSVCCSLTWMIVQKAVFPSVCWRKKALCAHLSFKHEFMTSQLVHKLTESGKKNQQLEQNFGCVEFLGARLVY